MSPYAFKALRLVGGAVFSLSITSLITIYARLHELPRFELLLALAVAGLAGFAVYTLFYFLQISETNDLIGIYMPVRELNQIDGPLTLALKIQPYYEYYRERPEDGAIRASLKANRGVVILGKPFSGKTRAALRRIAQTHPDAFVASFASPDHMTPDRINKIILPSFFILFAKPEVVLLIDGAQRFAQYPFEELLVRLRKQCSRLSMVVTCRTGVDQTTLGEGGLQQLVRDLPRVELGPLDPQTRADIYSHVFKEKPGPLGIDMSLPGLIISGPNGMRGSYLKLPPRSRRVITALGLARACGVETCERAFLADILQNALSQDILEIELSISKMEKDYILTVDGKGRISLQHDEFVLADYRDYYPTILDLKKDLRKVESLPAVAGNADRLLQLGLHYWSRLQDLASARRVLEASSQQKPSAFVHASLARLYLWLNEPERARTAIDAALAATKEQNKKAVALMAFADELLFRFADGEKAAGWYTLAAQCATDRATSASISFRYGDCLVRLKRFSEAEPIYRNYMTQAPAFEKNAATARLLLSVLAQDRAPEVWMLLRQAWNGVARQEWLSLAFSLFENAEGFFPDMAPQLRSVSNGVWEEYRDRILSLNEPDGVPNSLLLLADGCILRGFIATATAAYAFVIAQADKFHLEASQLVSSLINWGAGLRDCQQFADARAAFGRAERLARTNPAIKDYLAYAIAGLADCDLFEKQSEADAGTQYREALNLARESNDENAESWAQTGLGDISLMNGDFTQAKAHYGAPLLIVDSVSGQSRIGLGMARACLELGELDDAEFYIANGIALTLRLDYRFRQAQFQELKRLVAQKRETEFGSSVAAG